MLTNVTNQLKLHSIAIRPSWQLIRKVQNYPLQGCLGTRGPKIARTKYFQKFIRNFLHVRLIVTKSTERFLANSTALQLSCPHPLKITQLWNVKSQLKLKLFEQAAKWYDLIRRKKSDQCTMSFLEKNNKTLLGLVCSSQDGYQKITKK